MRKVAVKCAAANDDDDDFGSLFEERAPKKPRISQPSNVDAAPEQPTTTKKKKEKEFAWMDSDGESEADASEEKPEEEVDEDVTTERLDMVSSFGQMMLLSESLHRKLKSSALEPTEVAAACRALARSKFFDGDLLEDLSSCLLTMVKEDKLTIEQVTDVMNFSKELNYYRKDIFAAIAKVFRAKVFQMNQAVRNSWKDTMIHLEHKGDFDFLQMLDVPPLLPTEPGYGKSLSDVAKEDVWRNRTVKGKVLMTHDQKYVFKEKETGQSASSAGGFDGGGSGSDGGGKGAAMMQTMQAMMQMMMNMKGGQIAADGSSADPSEGKGGQGAVGGGFGESWPELAES